MSFNIEKIEKLSESLIATLKRFPMASFSAFLFTVIIVSLVELDFHHESEEVIIAMKVAFVISLGIPLFPALRLLYPSFLMNLLGIAILSGYYYILPKNILNYYDYIYLRHTLLIIASLIMLIWSPFINIEISNKNIWEWTQKIILALLSSILFSMILYLGIVLALYAIEQLFEVNIEAKRYFQLLIIVFGLYGVNFFLSQIPKYILLVQVKTYGKIEIIFTKYILTLLTIGYFIILFTYDIKILMSMKFPKGILAWLTVIFSIIAIITHLFWTPLWNEKGEKYKRYIYLSVMMQTVMLGLSIWIRIEEYGFTESRYFISLFGLWLFFLSLYFMLVKNASYKWLFISLSVLIVASQFGKYSASEISKNDQINRLAKLLSETKKPLNNDTNITVRYRISNIIAYLSKTHGKESLDEVIPNISKKLQDSEFSNFSYFVTKELGFDFVTRWELEEYMRFQGKKRPTIIRFSSPHGSRNSTIEIKDYKWLRWFNSDDKITKKIVLENNNLYIKDEKKILINMDMNSVINTLKKKYDNRAKGGYINLYSDNMDFTFKNTTMKAKLLIENIAFSDDGNISDLDCWVLW